MARREFLMLAKVYDPEKHKIGGWYVSEKHDGTRCFWDGGISRGLPTAQVPWAGVLDPKTGQRKANIKQLSTGLWSRYGNPIIAPDWWLNTLPCVPLDGELWAGRGNYQKCRSIAGKHEPIDGGSEWHDIQFGVFSTPEFAVVMAEGEIKNTNQLTDIRTAAVQKWVNGVKLNPDWNDLRGSNKTRIKFANELATLAEWIDISSDTVFLINHTKLPADHNEAALVVSERLATVLKAGGEGLVLRNPDSYWVPKRVDGILKVKGSLDDEGTLTGLTSGRKTTKGSKLLGKIGALILDYKGQRLELSGMTDEEREFADPEMALYATANPGQDMPPEFQGKYFKLGDKVTFTYRELTDDGIPKEARLLRVRQEA